MHSYWVVHASAQKWFNWIASNTSSSYYLSKSHTYQTDISVLQHVLKMSSFSKKCKWWTLTPLANSMFNNRWPRAVHSLLMRHFSDPLSWHMHYPVWWKCCKWPNCNFCISQGSVATVATVLRWDNQNNNHLCRVSSWCRVTKIIQISQCFTKLFKKQKWHIFIHTVYFIF